jgi:predicted dehydrogenase
MRAISKVDDYFEIILFCKNNLRVRIHSTYLAREASIGYIFHGTKGSFIKPKTNVQELALVNHQQPNEPNWGVEPEEEWGLLHTEIDGEVIRKKIPSLAGQYMNYYEGVYQAIAQQKPLPVNASEALLVVKIIEAAFASNAAKKIVEL